MLPVAQPNPTLNAATAVACGVRGRTLATSSNFAGAVLVAAFGLLVASVHVQVMRAAPSDGPGCRVLSL